MQMKIARSSSHNKLNAITAETCLDSYATDVDPGLLDEYDRLLLKECELEMQLRDIEDAVHEKYPEAEIALAIKDDLVRMDQSMPLEKRLLLQRIKKSADTLMETIDSEISIAQRSIKRELMRIITKQYETEEKIERQQRSRKAAEIEAAAEEKRRKRRALRSFPLARFTEMNNVVFKIFAIIEVASIAVSLCMNLLLSTLILHRSSNEIGAYRYLLLVFALNNIYFPSVHALTLPVVCPYDNAYIMFANGILTSKFSMCFAASTFSQTMPILAHLFIYRLIAVKWPHNLQYYTKRSTFLLIIFTVAVESLVWFLACFFYYNPNEELRNYVQPYLDQNFEGIGKDFIGVLYYTVNGELITSAVLATIVFNIIMISIWSIIIICSIAIVAHFRRKTNLWSERTKKLQRQMFYTLLAQMLFPMTFVFIPSMGAINLPILGFQLSINPKLVSICVATYPTIDAVVIIYGVKCYRYAIFSMLKRSQTTMHMFLSSTH